MVLLAKAACLGMPDLCAAPQLVVLICTDSSTPQDQHLLLGMHLLAARLAAGCSAGHWQQLLRCLAAGVQARTAAHIITLLTEQVLQLCESQQATQLQAIR